MLATKQSTVQRLVLHGANVEFWGGAAQVIPALLADVVGDGREMLQQHREQALPGELSDRQQAQRG